MSEQIPPLRPSPFLTPPLSINLQGNAAQIPSKGPRLPTILANFLAVLIKATLFYWVYVVVNSYLEKKKTIKKMMGDLQSTSVEDKRLAEKQLATFSTKELESYWSKEENQEDFKQFITRLPSENREIQLIEGLSLRIKILPQLFSRLNQVLSHHYSEEDIRFYSAALKQLSMPTIKQLQHLIFEGEKVLRERPQLFKIIDPEVENFEKAYTAMTLAMAEEPNPKDVSPQVVSSVKLATQFYQDLVNTISITNTQELDESRKLVEANPLEMRHVPLLHAIVPTPASLLCEFHVVKPSLETLDPLELVDFKGFIEFQITDPKTLATASFRVALPFAGKMIVKDAQKMIALIATEKESSFDEKYAGLSLHAELKDKYQKEWKEFLKSLEYHYKQTLALTQTSRGEHSLFEQSAFYDYQANPTIATALKAASLNSIFWNASAQLSLLPVWESRFDDVGRLTIEEEGFLTSAFKQGKEKIERNISIPFMNKKREKIALQIPFVITTEIIEKDGINYLYVEMKIVSKEPAIETKRALFYKIDEGKTEQEVRTHLAENRFFLRDLLLTKGTWYAQALEKTGGKNL